MIDESGAKLSGPLSQLVRFLPASCEDVMQNYMGIALAFEYGKHFGNSDAKERIHKLVGYIREAMLDSIENTSWMTEYSKAKAKEKAQSMAIYVGSPSDILDEPTIANIYKDFQPDYRTYFENLLSIRKIMTDLEFSQLDATKSYYALWNLLKGTFETNTFYYREFNTVHILPGMTLSEFYNLSQSESLNFGSLGSLIAHEMSHALDGNCINYDRNGNKLDSSLFDITSSKELDKKLESLLYDVKYRRSTIGHQVSNYSVNEDFADLSGFLIAHRANRRYAEKVLDNSESLNVGNFNYNQLFWIGAAGNWCRTHQRDESAPHSENRVRVNAAFSNLDEFTEDFGCSPRSRMNPDGKLRIWD